MEAKPTPRINSSMLSSHLNQVVRICGKVVQVHNGQALIEASDQGQISVRMHPSSPPYKSEFVEIVGRVDGDLSVQEWSVAELGNSFGKALLI